MPFPIRRGGGGAGVAVEVVVSGSPFADESARDVWANASQSNRNELFNEQDDPFRVAVALVGGVKHTWSGENQPSTYSNSGWIPDPVSLTSGQSQLLSDLADLPDNAIPKGQGSSVTNSGLMSEEDGSVTIDQNNSVNVGLNVALNGPDALLGYDDLREGDRHTIVTNRVNTDGTGGKAFRFAPSLERTIDPLGTGATTGPDRVATVDPVTGLYYITQDFTVVSDFIIESSAYDLRSWNGITAQGNDATIILQGYLGTASNRGHLYFSDGAVGPGQVFEPKSGREDNYPIADFDAFRVIPEEYATYEGQQATAVWYSQFPFTFGTFDIDGNNFVAIKTTGRDLNEIVLADLSDLHTDRAAITSFDIQGQSASVPAGTTISGLQTFQYSVTNNDQVVGMGTISQDGTDLSSSVDPASTSIDLTVTSETLSGGESTVFTLSFQTDAGVTLTRNFTVRAAQQSETLYYGVSVANNAETIPEGQLTTQDVVSGTQFPVSFTLPASNYAIILSPADREITSILDSVFNQETLTDYTKTEDVRTIGGQSYDAYVHQNQSNVQGVLAATVTVG